MVISSLIAIMLACAPQVDRATANALVSVESAFNPYAIGVVGGALERQPRNQAEALATARMLQANHWNFSVGLAQINARNFERLGLTFETAFEPCANLGAMQAVLAECYSRTGRNEHSAQSSLRQALSCYYSGNFVAGFAAGYVHRVAHAVSTSSPLPAFPQPHLKESS